MILFWSLIIVIALGFFVWVAIKLWQTHQFNKDQYSLVIGSIHRQTRPFYLLLFILGVIIVIAGYLLYKEYHNDPITITYDEQGNATVKDSRCEEEQHWEDGRCISNVRSTYIENGIGEEHRLGTERSSGIITQCNDGYVMFNGGCSLIEEVPEELLTSTIAPDLPAYCDRGIVNYIVDGDTIEVDNQRVRLVGIDTPELSSNDYFAQEAKQGITRFINGKKVCLSADTISKDKDIYDRLLRYVYLEDGTFINAEMIKHGFAKAYTKYPFHFEIWFTELAQEAKASKIGLWDGISY